MTAIVFARRPARDVRLPQRGEFAVALGNATRIGIALLAGATFCCLPDGPHLWLP
jgi:hypothetical protein